MSETGSAAVARCQSEFGRSKFGIGVKFWAKIPKKSAIQGSKNAYYLKRGIIISLAGKYPVVLSNNKINWHFCMTKECDFSCIYDK